MLKLGATLYSFQDDFRQGKLDLEGAVCFLSDIGAYGVEIVPEQTLTDVQYETIDENFVAYWKDLVAKYKLFPTNCNLYDDYDMFANRYLTEDERYQQFKHGVLLAETLGFRSVRGCPDMPPSLLERCIKVAEDHGIIVSLEVHAPFSMKSTWMQTWFDMIERTGTEYAGIHPDAAIFSVAPHATELRNALARGANPEILEYIKEAYRKNAERRAREREMLVFGKYRETTGYGAQEMIEQIKRMGGGELELSFAGRLTCDSPDWIVEYAKYIKHFHGKFYDMEPDGQGGWYDPSIDFEGIIRALKKIGYTGFISAEYEGQGAYRAIDNPDPGPSGTEMVKKLHAMIRALEARIDAEA
ncbi:MAG: hypothetical protein IKS29_04345 [Oscillospiraceae bacterium]|nr:hypothetical protein [Oscillospiraceae bacterium]